jgi:hypothetical protein
VLCSISGAVGARNGAVSARCPGVELSAYTLTVETKLQCAARGRSAATARRTWPGWRDTSTTASNSCPASGARPSGSSRSTRMKRAPSAIAPATPRAAQLTSWPAAQASRAIARPRNCVPPRINRRMRPSVGMMAQPRLRRNAPAADCRRPAREGAGSQGTAAAMVLWIGHNPTAR